MRICELCKYQPSNYDHRIIVQRVSGSVCVMLWSVNQKNPYISIDMLCCWWCFQCNGRGGSFGGMIRLRLQSGVLEKTKVLMASIFLVEQKIS